MKEPTTTEPVLEAAREPLELYGDDVIRMGHLGPKSMNDAVRRVLRAALEAAHVQATGVPDRYFAQEVVTVLAEAAGFGEEREP